jgi:hypothetical protein
MLIGYRHVDIEAIDAGEKRCALLTWWIQSPVL